MTIQVLFPCEGPTAAIGLAVELSIFHFVEQQHPGCSFDVRTPTRGFWWASGRPVSMFSIFDSPSSKRRTASCWVTASLIRRKASVFRGPPQAGHQPGGMGLLCC
jgi:hypothetical protein